MLNSAVGRFMSGVPLFRRPAAKEFKMKKFRLLGSSALVPAALFGAAMVISSPARAQVTGQEGQVTPPAAQEPVTPAGIATQPATPPAESDAAIVVTGSRLRTVTPFNSP